MPNLVSDHKSLCELYGELLVSRREIERQDMAGLSCCCYCECRKANHLPDERCSLVSGSRSFRSKRADELTAINTGLDLIESLKDLTY